GRWVSVDPIGFEAGDYNLYRDLKNGPTNATDPSGDFFLADNKEAALAWMGDLRDLGIPSYYGWLNSSGPYLIYVADSDYPKVVELLQNQKGLKEWQIRMLRAVRDGQWYNRVAVTKDYSINTKVSKEERLEIANLRQKFEKLDADQAAEQAFNREFM